MGHEAERYLRKRVFALIGRRLTNASVICYGPRARPEPIEIVRPQRDFRKRLDAFYLRVTYEHPALDLKELSKA